MGRVVIAPLASVPLGVAFAFTEDALLASGQDPALSAAAHAYVSVQISSVFLFLIFVALRQYLQGRELMRPAFGSWRSKT